jgi:hypothetical protein
MLYITLKSIPFYNLSSRKIEIIRANTILTYLYRTIVDHVMLTNNQKYAIPNLWFEVEMNNISPLT